MNFEDDENLEWDDANDDLNGTIIFNKPKYNSSVMTQDLDSNITNDRQTNSTPTNINNNMFDDNQSGNNSILTSDRSIASLPIPTNVKNEESKTYETPTPKVLRSVNNPNLEGFRYRIPLDSHTLVLGPTQSGKTSLILKFFIDGFDFDLGKSNGKKPFDMLIYVGNEEPSHEFTVAAQVTNYTYLNIKPSQNQQIPVFFIPKSELVTKLGATLNNEKFKPLKKLVIIDDVIKVNDAKTNNTIASLVSEGQHINSYFILVMHNASGEKVVELRNACRTKIFVGPVTGKQLNIVCGDSLGANAYSQYANYINSIPAFEDDGEKTHKKILIYDSFTKTFFNYNLEKINI